MFNILLWLLTLGAVQAKATHKRYLPHDYSLEHLGRVIGGENAKALEFPFAAFLMVNEGHATAFCGGSILNNQWILTAGHCVIDTSAGKDHSMRKYPIAKAKDIRVGVGSIYNQRTQILRVSRVDVHPDVNLDYFDNDVAVLKLHSKLQFNQHVQPIRIDTGSVPDGLTVTGIGWGKTTIQSQHTSDILQTVDLTTGNSGLCHRIRPQFDSNNGNYICVTTPDGRDTCSGDSGGPLLRRCNNDPRLTGASGAGPWLQLGITSYGDDAGGDSSMVCGSPEGAGFYTHAARYLDFISKKTKLPRADLAAACNGNEVSYPRRGSSANTFHQINVFWLAIIISLGLLANLI